MFRLQFSHGWRLPLALLLVAAISVASAAVPPPYRARLGDIVFQHVTQDQGLPNAIAVALAEDGQGFLWIGSPS
ncbi:two-component regulator propeller domain-containing protein, partial [Acinetobacter baumannii]